MNIREFFVYLNNNDICKKHILYVHPKELSSTFTKVLFNTTVKKQNIEIFAIDTNILYEYNQIFVKEFNDNNKRYIIITNEKYKNKEFLTRDKKCRHISLTCTVSA